MQAAVPLVPKLFTTLRGYDRAQLLRDAPVLVSDLPVFEVFGVADRPAVILGMDWLESARMIVDFPARKVWFVAAGR